MTFSRNQFFGCLFIVLVCPFIIYKIVWLLRSEKTNGTTEFIGHGNLGSVLGMTTYPVIMFVADKDTLHFNGNINIELKRGQEVAIRYQKSDPEDARVDTFISIWGDTLAYTIGPLLVFLGLFFTKDIIPTGFHTKTQRLPTTSS